MYAAARITSTKAYRMAQKALKFNEDMTFSPDEIDMLTPSSMPVDGREGSGRSSWDRWSDGLTIGARIQQ